MRSSKPGSKDTPPQELRTKERLVHINRVGALSADEVQRLLAELAIYQAELEAQNEDLRRAELLVELERRRYIDLFQSAPIGYLTLDKAGKISEINQAMITLIKKPRQLLIGQPLANLVSAADLRSLRNCLSLVADSVEPQTCNVNLRASQGPTVPVQILANATSGGDPESSGMIRISVVDSTARLVAEQHQKDLSLYFNRLSAELTATSAEMEAIAHSVADELEKPLETLSTNLRALKDVCTQHMEVDVGRKLEASHSAVFQLSELARRLHKLTRLGTITMVKSDVDLSAIAHIIVDELQGDEPGREVTVVIADHLHVRGDRNLITLALRHLLSNAWKFTLDTTDARILFDRLPHTVGRDTFFIRDNGVGFNMEDVNKLFLPFQRLHADSDHPGTAMGLAIVQRIIRRHGGTIWAESEPGKGAAFFFTFSA